jgi:type II secretory pathway component PulF
MSSGTGSGSGSTPPPNRRPLPRNRPAAAPLPPEPEEDEYFGPSTFQAAKPSAHPSRAPVGGGGGANPTAGAGGKAARPKPGASRRESGGPKLFERIVFGSVSAGHLATFCRQASAYLSAGVNVVKALGSLQQQFAGTALGPVIEHLQVSVRRGDSLVDAMAREPQAFDEQFLAMMRVAEARGGVPETLRHLAQHYESRQRLIRQARSALIYPLAVVVVALGVGYLLTVFVLPAIVELLGGLTSRGNVPGVTRALMALSEFMRTVGWWAVPLGLVAAVFLLVRFYRTAPGKALIDELGLAFPVIGDLLRLLDVSRFARTLATLLEAGVDFGAALDLTRGVVRLAPHRRALGTVRTEVLDGSELSAALADTRRFPTEVIAYVETGESTGRLPESLEKLADEYDERIEHAVKSLSSLVQPLIVVVLGGFVLFIALGMIMAYVSAISNLAAGNL